MRLCNKKSLWTRIVYVVQCFIILSKKFSFGTLLKKFSGNCWKFSLYIPYLLIWGFNTKICLATAGGVVPVNHIVVEWFAMSLFFGYSGSSLKKIWTHSQYCSRSSLRYMQRTEHLFFPTSALAVWIKCQFPECNCIITPTSTHHVCTNYLAWGLPRALAVLVVIVWGVETSGETYCE